MYFSLMICIHVGNRMSTVLMPDSVSIIKIHKFERDCQHKQILFTSDLVSLVISIHVGNMINTKLIKNMSFSEMYTVG